MPGPVSQSVSRAKSPSHLVLIRMRSLTGPVSHGLSCILEQIDQHLFDLGHVHGQLRQIWVRS